MPTRQEILAELRGGSDYEQAAHKFGIPAGQTYLIATGLPADGSGALGPEDFRRSGIGRGSSQYLVNPGHPEHPARKEQVLEWIRRRAESDQPMQHAFQQRVAATAEVSYPDEAEITTVLGRDHNRAKALLQELAAIPGTKESGSQLDLQRRQSIVDALARALSLHEAAEEKHFWPRVRKALPDGDGWAERALAQEQEATKTVAVLGEHSSADEEFDGLVEALTTQLRRHVSLAEQVFVALTEAVDVEERRRWGRLVAQEEAHEPAGRHASDASLAVAALKTEGRAAAVVDAIRETPASSPGDGEGHPQTDENQAR